MVREGGSRTFVWDSMTDEIETVKNSVRQWLLPLSFHLLPSSSSSSS